MINETTLSIEQIETAIVGFPGSPYYMRKNIVIPNVDWGFLNHEADLLILTKANYLVEIEIKRSWIDFMADFKKKHTHNDPKLSYISGLQQGCMKGKFPADCMNCDCEDKYWVDVRITTSTTDTIDGKYENTSFSIPFEKNKMKNKMNIRKAKKLYKAGTLFRVEGTNVVGMSLGCNRKNEIDSFNLIDILTGESVKRCDGKCRLATKKEQRLYFASLRAIMFRKAMEG